MEKDDKEEEEEEEEDEEEEDEEEEEEEEEEVEKGGSCWLATQQLDKKISSHHFNFEIQLEAPLLS